MKYGLLLLTLLLSACAQEEFRGSMATIPGPSTRTEVIVHHESPPLYVDYGYLP
jgi:hypothetical protein